MSERDKILAAVQGQRVSSTGWVRINCPVCIDRKGSPDRRQSFGFRPATGGFRCFRCGARGRMQGEGYALPEEIDKGEDRPRVVLGDTSDYFQLGTDQGWRSESLAPAREFLLRRGIEREHMQAADMRAAVAGKYAGRIIVPHFDALGSWWGFTARLWTNPPKDGPPKVLYPPSMDRSKLYNEHVLFDASTVPVMLVEGCLDAAWYLPLCVAALGKPTRDHFETLCSARRPIVICLDGDAWEEGRALAYRLRLRGVRAGFVQLPAGEDPNSINPTMLREQVAAAELGEPCKTSNHSPPSPTY